MIARAAALSAPRLGALYDDAARIKDPLCQKDARPPAGPDEARHRHGGRLDKPVRYIRLGHPEGRHSRAVRSKAVMMWSVEPGSFRWSSHADVAGQTTS